MAGLTFQFLKSVKTHGIYSSNVSEAPTNGNRMYIGSGWQEWPVRTELNSSGFPSNVLSKVETVNKWSLDSSSQNGEVVKTEDKVFLLSVIEINKYDNPLTVGDSYVRPNGIIYGEGVGHSHNESYLFYASDKNRTFSNEPNSTEGSCLLRSVPVFRAYVRFFARGADTVRDDNNMPTGKDIPYEVPWVPAFCM